MKCFLTRDIARGLITSLKYVYRRKFKVAKINFHKNMCIEIKVYD